MTFMPDTTIDMPAAVRKYIRPVERLIRIS